MFILCPCAHFKHEDLTWVRLSIPLLSGICTGICSSLVKMFLLWNILALGPPAFHWTHFKILSIFFHLWLFPAVFTSIFQDPAIFIFVSPSIPAPFYPPAMYMCSYSPLTPSHLALSHYVSLFIPYSRCAPCLCSPPNCSDCCFHALSCSFHSSFSVEFQWAASSSELPVPCVEKNGMMGGMTEWGRWVWNDRKEEKTINFNCC